MAGDILARYVYFSFEELMEVENLDLNAATQLLEICESTFNYEDDYDGLGSIGEVDNQAYAQRMRFVEEFGLYQDYPIKLSNLDRDLIDLCQTEDVNTFIELMAFLDRIADKAWMGGSFKSLQNVFAHGDENGLQKYFPYRSGHRGFHLPEAVSFCLSRLTKREQSEIFEYHEWRRRKGRIITKRMELPAVVEKQVLPEIFQCMHYFGKRQQRLLVRLHDSVYFARELMYLNDPQTEGVLHWLVHLALGVFRPSQESELANEVKEMSVRCNSEIFEDLHSMVNEG
ncbi:MAG: hypothetical protein AAGC73_00575 [Verrucomicrobiota bacterium]